MSFTPLVTSKPIPHQISLEVQEHGRAFFFHTHIGEATFEDGRVVNISNATNGAIIFRDEASGKAIVIDTKAALNAILPLLYPEQSQA